MITHNEHELRAMASEMRPELDRAGIPDRIWRKVTKLIGFIKGAVVGKVSQEALQTAVDQVNFNLGYGAARPISKPVRPPIRRIGRIGDFKNFKQTPPNRKDDHEHF
ncbi:hypothetical protein JZU54_01435 [bacterium]|jgi:hypothetical protein|nr:hypothetical protein [bacterium]